MFSWRFKRKFYYGFGALSVLVLLIGVPIFLALYETPTCFDGKQNGRETGIDCGGSCVRLCSAELIAPIVRWTRVLPVSPGVYSVLASVENPNVSTVGRGGVYTVKLFDERGAVLAERSSSITIPAIAEVPVFVGNLNTGVNQAVRATFVFDKQPEWQKLPENEPRPILDVSNEALSKVRGSVRLSARISNTSVYDAREVYVVAELANSQGNIVAASQTFVDALLRGESKEVVFTWPIDFGMERVVRITVTPIPTVK